jgi:hypothetical protein
MQIIERGTEPDFNAAIAARIAATRMELDAKRQELSAERAELQGKREATWLPMLKPSPLRAYITCRRSGNPLAPIAPEVVGSRAFASPKSSTFTVPSSLTLMFAGFRSR